jgi:hypothetical protein
VTYLWPLGSGLGEDGAVFCESFCLPNKEMMTTNADEEWHSHSLIVGVENDSHFNDFSKCKPFLLHFWRSNHRPMCAR